MLWLSGQYSTRNSETPIWEVTGQVQVAFAKPASSSFCNTLEAGMGETKATLCSVSLLTCLGMRVKEDEDDNRSIYSQNPGARHC